MDGGILTGSVVPAAATLFIVALLCFLIVRRFRTRRTCPLPRCPQCRYVAAGLMGTRCPECGHDHDRDGVLPARTPRPLPLWLAIALWLLLAGAVWAFIIEPVADRLSVAREIKDSISLSQPRSGRYESVQLRVRALEWPIDLIKPHGTWTLTLRASGSGEFTLTFGSDDETMTVERLAAWIARQAALDEVTPALRSEATEILTQAQQPGDRRGVIRFGVATRQNVGMAGPTRPFGQRHRRISLQPVELAWPWYSALASMILVATMGVGWLILRERRWRRRCALAWTEIRPTPTDRQSLPMQRGHRAAGFL